MKKLKYFLGIEVAYSKCAIFISQRNDLLDILKETNKLGCKTSVVPIEHNHRIVNEEGSSVEMTHPMLDIDRKPLIYLSLTRPAIVHAVSVVSQLCMIQEMTHALIEFFTTQSQAQERAYY